MWREPGQLSSVLVVDDDPDILEFLHDLLELEGYAVTTSLKGEALEQFPFGWLPDLILLDVFLSGKDGCELVMRLKREQQTEHIPIIMFSAHPSAEKSALTAGADAFLFKPFNTDDLLTRIRTFLLVEG
jgi:CheY-like chemotaxis protein